MSFFDGHIRDLGTVPDALLASLTDKVLGIDNLWDVENEKKPNSGQLYNAFGDSTRHIIFQFPVHPQNHRESYYTAIWQEWAPSITPLIEEIGNRYGYSDGRTGRIMLTNLGPHGVITKHIDQNRSAAIPHKIHVPLQTSPEVTFFEEDSSYHLARGHAYEVNNRIRHGVKNPTEQERIHLIFDYYDASRTQADEERAFRRRLRVEYRG